jgi:hypothetical protein
MRRAVAAAVVLSSIVLVLAGWLARRAWAAEEPLRDTIVPLVVLPAGETRDVLLSSSCARITRGRGLMIRAMGEDRYDAKKTWSRDGLTVSYVSPEEQRADEPAALSEAGYKAFVVRLSAADDATAGMLDLHLTDETCSGQCAANLRVVVVAP